MAQPSTILNEARREVTALVNDLYRVDEILHVIEDVGATDPERQTFFAAWVTAQTDYDITTADLLSAVGVLRALRTWLDVNRPVLAKLKV